MEPLIKEPLMRSQVRIAASMGGILRPASELLPMIGKMFPSAESCNVTGFVDCLWTMPMRERRGPRIMSGKCAVDNKCTIEQTPDEFFRLRAPQAKKNLIASRIQRIGRQIARDF
jgi:hypothetical protein